MDPKQTTPRCGSVADRRLGIDPRGEILDYLRTHPSAADTLDGIVEWWLPRQRHDTAKKTIKRALDDLVGQGLLDELVSDIGLHLYRLHRTRE